MLAFNIVDLRELYLHAGPDASLSGFLMFCKNYFDDLAVQLILKTRVCHFPVRKIEGWQGEKRLSRHLTLNQSRLLSDGRLLCWCFSLYLTVWVCKDTPSAGWLDTQYFSVQSLISMFPQKRAENLSSWQLNLERETGGEGTLCLVAWKWDTHPVTHFACIIDSIKMSTRSRSTEASHRPHPRSCHAPLLLIFCRPSCSFLYFQIFLFLFPHRCFFSSLFKVGRV